MSDADMMPHNAVPEVQAAPTTERSPTPHAELAQYKPSWPNRRKIIFRTINISMFNLAVAIVGIFVLAWYDKLTIHAAGAVTVMYLGGAALVYWIVRAYVYGVVDQDGKVLEVFAKLAGRD